MPCKYFEDNAYLRFGKHVYEVLLTNGYFWKYEIQE